MANLLQRRHVGHPDSARPQAYQRKQSGVRRIPTERTSEEREIRLLYRQLSEGSLDLSAPSLPPLVRSSEEGEPVTAQIHLPDLPDTPPTARNVGVLVRIDGPECGKVHAVKAGELLIGRTEDAAIRVVDDGVSRRHATVLHSGGSFFLQDLDSSNGTFLEGKRVRRAPLMEGDLVQFGPHTSYRFCLMDEAQYQALNRLFDESTLDPLTRTRNRRYLDSRLDQEIAYAQRHQSRLSVCLLGLDYFTHVNGRHGHRAGNTVLQRVADCMADELRTEDTLGRFGPDEFAVILRGVDTYGAEVVAERLRVAVQAQAVCVGRVTIRVTASVASAELVPQSATAKEDLMVNLSERLARAKRQGRNQVCAD